MSILVPDCDDKAQIPLHQVVVTDLNTFKSLNNAWYYALSVTHRKLELGVEVGLDVLIVGARPPVAELEQPHARLGREKVDEGVGVLGPLTREPRLAQRHVEGGARVPHPEGQLARGHALVLLHTHDLTLTLQRPLQHILTVSSEN